MEERIPKFLLANVALFVALILLVLPTVCQQGNNSTNDFQSAAPFQDIIILRSGEPFRYTYYFDHNALKDAVRAGSVLIALTESGDLVRFDGTTLKITGQQIVPGHASAISLAEDGRVLVGTEAGIIVEVDSATLKQTPLFTTKGRVVWLGSVTGKDTTPMTVAVLDNSLDLNPWPGEDSGKYDKRARHAQVSRVNPFLVTVYESGTVRSFPLSSELIFPLPSSFLLDNTGTLWMGRDKGEWGGSFSSMDLHAGKVSTSSTDSGVQGFLRCADGRLFVYGGMSHMGVDEGYVAEVKAGVLEFKSRFRNDSLQKSLPLPENVQRLLDQDNRGHKFDPENLPHGPVDLMMEDLYGNGFWVVSSHVLYHASTNLSEWSKTMDLGGRWYGGRQYSVGNTPTVRRLILDQSASQDMLAIAVMGRDGLEKISQGRVHRLAASGQLESPIMDIWTTSIGTIFLAASDEHSAWRFAAGQWQKLKFFQESNWGFAEPFADDGSAILAFTGDNTIPGERGLTKVGPTGTAELANTWKDDSTEWHTFFILTSQHELLRITDNTVQIRAGAIWREAGSSKVPLYDERKGLLVGRRHIFLGTVGDKDFYLDSDRGDLLELTRKPDHTFLFDYVAHAAVSGIFDAVADQDGWFLAATANGLRRFRLENSRNEVIPHPNASEEIKSLCRDAQGRLWAAGDHLYISADKGKHWEQVFLPMLVYTYSKRIRQNPQDEHEIMLAMFNQGVVFIKW